LGSAATTAHSRSHPWTSPVGGRRDTTQSTARCPGVEARRAEMKFPEARCGLCVRRHMTNGFVGCGGKVPARRSGTKDEQRRVRRFRIDSDTPRWRTTKRCKRATKAVALGEEEGQGTCRRGHMGRSLDRTVASTGLCATLRSATPASKVVPWTVQEREKKAGTKGSRLTQNIKHVVGVHGSYHGQAIHGHWCSRGIRNK
jgi:hypothetical protein